MTLLSPPMRVAWDEDELILEARVHLGHCVAHGKVEPERWNGWLCPAFDRANVDRIAAYNAAHPESTDQLSWDGDILVIADPDYPDEPPDRMAPIEWEGVPYWSVGAWGWTWYEVPPPCEHCGLEQRWHLTAEECERHGIDPGLRDGLGCAVIVRKG